MQRLVHAIALWYHKISNLASRPDRSAHVGWGVGALGKQSEQEFPRLPAHEGRERTMAKYMNDEVAYYYDSHPTEEDLMGETKLHSWLVHYLMDVLRQLFRGQTCALCENFNFYQTNDPMEPPIVPDIAVIKGVEEQDLQDMKSWRVGKTGPAPHVVFEIASEETWNKDLEEKPDRYTKMGVKEYFAYDPNKRPLRRARTGTRRLFGWQLDPEHRMMRELPTGPDGRIWSFHLQSWLVPEGKYLRLYDTQGNLRLTGEETQAQLAALAAERAEVAIRKAQALAEKFRSLGIDPDQI